MSQPDAREGQAGPAEESERSIVPLKPGNAGGGKGPDFEGVLEVTESREIGHVPNNSMQGSEVAEGAVSPGEGQPCARR